ncbi:MAG: hypothetical protein DRH37_03830 [Deltaproteobacteria bacterium]|nr:MAG: hypothetical protein DRH37_03830 [Deltaproteobacteria bacterium]
MFIQNPFVPGDHHAVQADSSGINAYIQLIRWLRQCPSPDNEVWDVRFLKTPSLCLWPGLSSRDVAADGPVSENYASFNCFVSHYLFRLLPVKRYESGNRQPTGREPQKPPCARDQNERNIPGIIPGKTPA